MSWYLNKPSLRIRGSYANTFFSPPQFVFHTKKTLPFASFSLISSWSNQNSPWKMMPQISSFCCSFWYYKVCHLCLRPETSISQMGFDCLHCFMFSTNGFIQSLFSFLFFISCFCVACMILLLGLIETSVTLIRMHVEMKFLLWFTSPSVFI